MGFGDSWLLRRYVSRMVNSARPRSLKLTTICLVAILLYLGYRSISSSHSTPDPQLEPRGGDLLPKLLPIEEPPNLRAPCVGEPNWPSVVSKTCVNVNEYASADLSFSPHFSANIAHQGVSSLPLCDFSTFSSRTATLKQAKVKVEPFFMRENHLEVSLAVFANCKLPGGPSALNKTLHSITQADLKIRKYSFLDLSILLDHDASQECWDTATALKYDHIGTKTIIQWQCQFQSSMDRWLSNWHPLPVEVDLQKARVVLEEGTLLSTQFMKYVNQSHNRYRSNHLPNALGAWLRPTPYNVPSSADVHAVTAAAPTKVANLRRPMPGHIAEMVLFAGPWSQFRVWYYERRHASSPQQQQRVDAETHTGLNDDLWRQSFSAHLALFCQEYNLYILTPGNLEGGKLLAVSMLDSAQTTTDALLPTPANRNARPMTFIPVAPCRYEFNQGTRDNINTVLERSLRHQLVGIVTVNDAFVPVTWSWLCHTARIARVHEQVVIVATDKLAFDKLSANPFGVPVILEAAGTGASDTEDLTFGTFAYGEMMVRRLNFNAELVNCGANLLIFETDAVWARNALELVPRQDSGIDMRMYVNQHTSKKNPKTKVTASYFEFGGGFMYIKPSSRSSEVLSAVSERYMGHIDGWPVARNVTRGPTAWLGGDNDQTIMSSLLNFEAANFLVNYDHFSEEAVLSGKWYELHPSPKSAAIDKSVFVINNNFIKGNQLKYERAETYGHWFLEGPHSLECVRSRIDNFFATVTK